MPNLEEEQPQQQQQEEENVEEEEGNEEEEEEEEDEEEETTNGADAESEISDDEAVDPEEYYVTDDENNPRPHIGPDDDIPASDNTPEINIRRFTRVLNSKTVRERQEEEIEGYFDIEDLYDFPEDPEKWEEGDLKEMWADAPLQMTKPGWDPVWADEEDWQVMKDEIKEGRDPPIAPFYLPYRKPYPVIPDNHHDISSPKAVIEELDRVEEFLTWVSYIFADGSSYEGTVWDDLAHGKGVYITEQGLVRYDGEWLQNDMEGHGVVEVDIPDIEPVPGSKLEEKMRAEGKIISRDFMSLEDKKWLEMDIEDSIRLADGEYEIPFYENDAWIKHFGSKPEKGRYRYAGQWKHGRMHGCGLFEVNERPIYGRFYFGELLEDSEGCDEETVALHAGLAEVAAAKARMFVNKPDGMVREERGPYSDPQHPYFYEDEDVWMAPGFINQFHEVPDYWKTYVSEIDQEREMWLNSFYKSPLRIPMPAELEYWWEKEEPPEFVLVNKEPEPDPEDPSKLIYTEDPLILHTPTGRLINYIDDEKYGIRLFWQPPLKEGEEIDPEKIEFLPLGFDEFYGRQEVEENKTVWKHLSMAVEKVSKPVLDKLENWIEEKKKASELRMQIYEKELDMIEAELCLEEAIEDMEEEAEEEEEEEEEGKEKKVEMGLEKGEDTSALPSQAEKDIAEVEEEELKVNEDEDEEEEEEDEDDEDDNMPSSFGSVTGDQNPTKNDQKGKKPGESPFSSLSLSFASCSLVSSVPSRLQQSFLSWKQGRLSLKPTIPCVEDHKRHSVPVDTVHFPSVLKQRGSLKAIIEAHQKFQKRKYSNGKRSHLYSSERIQSCPWASVSPKRVIKAARSHRQSWLHSAPDCDIDSILSLHTPMCFLKSYTDTAGVEPHYFL